jgi:hypothetical protein
MRVFISIAWVGRDLPKTSKRYFKNFRRKKVLMRSREFDDIKQAAEELLKEKKARNEKCSVNYMEVSKRVGYLPDASVAMYL